MQYISYWEDHPNEIGVGGGGWEHVILPRHFVKKSPCPSEEDFEVGLWRTDLLILLITNSSSNGD